MTDPEHWPDWNLHASVIIGLAILGGLYVSWGGLAATRRQVLCFGAALALLFLSLNGPLHNLSDCCLFSAHMVHHLLLTLWVRALQGRLGPANAMTVEITGLYWHFVDVVWIIIFTVVYLIQ